MATGAFSVYYRMSTHGAGNNQFYSDGITGELKEYKTKIFEEYLTKYGLMEGFNKEKKPERLPDERPFAYHKREMAVKVKYYNLISEKMK